MSQCIFLQLFFSNYDIIYFMNIYKEKQNKMGIVLNQFFCSLINLF